MRQTPVCEWPTLALVVIAAGGWAVLISYNATFGLWVSFPLAAVLATLYSSLQHEVLHGHPTRSAVVNEALIYFPIGVFIPFRRFKQLHLRHHRNDRLTDPYDDPESFYWAWADWGRLPAAIRFVLRVNNTLLGRLVLGPAVSLVGFYGSELRRLRQNAPGVRNAWMHHAAGVVPVLVFVTQIGDLPLWIYLLGVAYPSMSLLMLRTYAEHRAHETPDGRTIIVEFCPVFSLLFLNNNLHLVHHTHPRVPWYALPTLYRQHRDVWHIRNGGYVYKSYFALARQYLLKVKEPVPHPLMLPLGQPKAFDMSTISQGNPTGQI